MALGVGKAMQLKIDKLTTRRDMTLKLRTNTTNLEAQVNGTHMSAQKAQDGEISFQTELSAGEATVITVQNISSAPATITNIIAQLTP